MLTESARTCFQRSPEEKFIMEFKGLLVAGVGFEPTTFRL